jgi:hypothetical protein
MVRFLFQAAILLATMGVGGATIAPPDDFCPEQQPEFGDDCYFYVPEGCSYGEETCCGETHPSVMVFCEDYIVNGYFTDACLHPSCEIGCPDIQPDFNEPCSFDVPEGCPYGEETCCGQTHPSMMMFCDDGTTFGYHTDACLQPCEEGCPEIQPEFNEMCNFNVPEGCPYGKEECCGETHPSTMMFCEEGYTYGFMTDACMHPHCGASSYGDPHFKTWSGDQFDFHGKCDLVLFQKADFANGLGMDVHVRTEIETWWSYIQRAAIRIGDHTLEVMGGKDSFQYWIDGDSDKSMKDEEEVAFGDFVLKYKVVNEHVHRFRLDLGDGDAISIEAYKKFVRVNFNPKSENKFDGGTGMLGSQPDGKKVARDGKTIVEDATEFGQEWQVLDTEARLFHGEGVEPPMKCVMPSETKMSQARRLGQSGITREDAELACAHVREFYREACIFDLLATNDIDSAGSY